MYGTIQPLVTHKRGVCTGLFNPLLHIRGVYVRGNLTPFYTQERCMYGVIQPHVTHKRGACMGLFNPLLHLKRGICMGLFNLLLYL
jgi:hypothetical protein